VCCLPSRAESFGHVVAEALGAGTPVIASDQTPWQPDGSRALLTLSLDSLNAWVTAIDTWCHLDATALVATRIEAIHYLVRHRQASDALQASRTMFEGASGRPTGGTDVPGSGNPASAAR